MIQFRKYSRRLSWDVLHKLIIILNICVFTSENVFPEYPWLGSPDTPNVLQESPVNEVPEHVCNSQYYGYAGSVDDEQQICVSYHREAGSCSVCTWDT